MQDVNCGQRILSRSNGLVQLQGFQCIRFRLQEQFTAGAHTEEPHIKKALRQVRVRLGIVWIDRDGLSIEFRTLGQLSRSHLVAKEIGPQCSLKRRWMDFTRGKWRKLSRVEELMNLAGNLLCYLCLQLKDVT